MASMRKAARWAASREVHRATGIMSWRVTKHPGGSTYYVRTTDEPAGIIFEVLTAAKGRNVGASVLAKLMPLFRAAIATARKEQQ